MASVLFWKIVISVISLSLASNWNGQTCTKQLLHKFYIHKFDSITRRIVSVEKFRKNIIFVCCEGYREISRRKELPNCVPICRQSCGYGYCYKPNLCACYYGYEVSSLDGTCKRIGSYSAVTKRVPPPLTTKLEVESSTLRMHTKPSSTVADLIQNEFISNKKPRFETTTQTSKQLKRFEMGSTRGESNFPRVKFITHTNSDLRTTNPTSTSRINVEVESATKQIDISRNNFEVESATKQIDIRPSLRTVDDFPRVKFITYGDFGLGTTSPISFGVESSTRQIDSKPSTADDFRSEYGGSRLETRNPVKSQSSEVETSKPQVNFELVNTELITQHTPNATRSKSPTRSIIDTIASFHELRRPANCTRGVCTCQMGYQLFDDRFCHACQIGSQCQCPDGYAFNSIRCMPLCNGVFDGCNRGTCIKYNKCSCNGTDGDYIFRCYAEEASVLDARKTVPKWCILLLLIPAVIMGFIFYKVVQRSRTSKSNRLKAQRNAFQEIRYFHTNNNHFVQRKYHEAEGRKLKESDFGEDVIQHDGNIIILKV